MKLTVVVPVPPKLVIVEDKAVRHVRTPEGRRRFGQPIGAVITRDVIERAKRRAATGGGDTRRSAGREDVPAAPPVKPRPPTTDTPPVADRTDDRPKPSSEPVTPKPAASGPGRAVIDPDGATEEVRAGDLKAGVWVLLPDRHDQLHPAEVTRAGTDDFGDFSLDYRWADGSEETVALDPSEIVHRIAGSPPEQSPDPAAVRDPEMVAVSAGEVQPGDRISAGDGSSLLVFARARDRATGLLRVSTVDENGRRDSALYPAGYGFELASAAEPPEPLPEGTPAARPALATYQRRAIAALDLEADEGSALGQAAARVRTRQPLSVEQASALSADLRRRAGEETRSARKRSLLRNAAQIGAVVTDLGGEFTPDQQERTKAERVDARGIAEGDQVAVVGPEGPVVGKVVGLREVLGGRLTELTLRDETGAERPVMLSRTAPAYLLPDLPEPEPVPDPVSAETVDRASVRVGDRIRVAVPSLAPFEGVVLGREEEFGEDEDGHPVPGVQLSLRIQTPQGEAVVSHGLYGTDTAELLERDVAGPPPDVERVRRIAAIEQELHRVVNAKTVGYGVLGRAHHLPDDPDSAQRLAADLTQNRESIAKDAGGVGARSLVQMLAPDADRETAKTLQSTLDAVLVQARSDQVDRVARGLRDWPPNPDRSLRGAVEEVLAATPPPDFERVAASLAEAGENLRRRQTEGIGFVAPTEERRKEVTDAVQVELRRQRAEFADRLDTLVEGMDRQQARGALARFGNTQPRAPSAGSVQRILAAAGYGVDPARMHTLVDPVSRELAEDNDKLLAEALAAMLDRKAGDKRTAKAALQAALQARDEIEQGYDADWWRAGNLVARVEVKLASGGDPEGQVEPDAVPAAGGQDLSARMGQLRALLPGDGAQFGSRRMTVSTFAPTTLADLEAGRVPEIVKAEVYQSDVEPGDGGPGEASLRQLAVIRQAGRELDERVQARVAELTREAADVQPGLADALREQARAAYEEAESLFQSHKARQARKADLPNWTALVRAYAELKARRERSPEENRRFNLIADLYEKGKAQPVESAEAFERYQALLDQSRGVRLAKRDAERARNRARSQAALEVLSEVREMGEAGDVTATFAQTRGDPLKAMRWAVQFYPRDWIRRAEQKRRQPINLKKVKRGYSTKRNRNGEPEIGLSAGSDHLGLGDPKVDPFRHVAVHEYGHQMEDSIDGIVAAERVFLWDRTSEGEVGSRTRTGNNAATRIYTDKTEVGRKDAFAEHYSGKEYPGSNNYELFTTGVESLFAGSPYLDDDFRRWLLGTMALL